MPSISETKANFNSLISSNNSTFVTKNGRAVAVLVPIAEYKLMFSAYKDAIYREAIESAKCYFQGQKEELLTEEEVHYRIDKMDHEQSDHATVMESKNAYESKETKVSSKNS